MLNLELDRKLIKLQEEIKKVKSKLFQDEEYVSPVENRSQFLIDFMRASWFCQTDDEEDRLYFVKTTENQIMAIDGYKAIIIKNDEIPEKLKNTLIPWNIREDFESHIHLHEIQYPDVEKLFKDYKKGFTQVNENVTSYNFYKLFILKESEITNYESVELTFGEEKIYFQKEFLDTALMVLKGERFKVCYKAPLLPLIMESDTIQVMVLPMRRMEE